MYAPPPLPNPSAPAYGPYAPPPPSPLTPQGYGAPIADYAGFWRRFVAYLIDWTLLAAVIAVPVGVVAGLAGSLRSGSGSSPVVTAAGLGLDALVFTAAWLYYALMESSTYQATLGKMALGLVVTDIDGNRIGFGRATGRHFAKIISGMLCSLGYVAAGFTERKQALHDLMASTLVVTKLR